MVAVYRAFLRNTIETYVFVVMESLCSTAHASRRLHHVSHPQDILPHRKDLRQANCCKSAHLGILMNSSARSHPVQNRIKAQARDHERFRKYCITFAQAVHRIDMRMRLGLLQDRDAIERQIAKDAARAEAEKKKAAIPAGKTEEQTKANETATAREKDEGTEKAKSAHKPRIRPLSEARAIEMGANFISEMFIYLVGISVITFETWRQRRKAANHRESIADDVDGLRADLKRIEEELAALKAGRQVEALPPPRESKDEPPPPAQASKDQQTPPDSR